MPDTDENVIDLVDPQPMMRVEISHTCPCDDDDAIELRHGCCLLRTTGTGTASDLKQAWCRGVAMVGNVVSSSSSSSSSSFSQRVEPAA